MELPNTQRGALGSSSMPILLEDAGGDNYGEMRGGIWKVHIRLEWTVFKEMFAFLTNVIHAKYVVVAANLSISKHEYNEPWIRLVSVSK